jgi:choline dehydrogenase-like flavoprotein
LRLAREIMRQPALEAVRPGRTPARRQSGVRRELFDYACAHAKTDHHPVGTCRIGPAMIRQAWFQPICAFIGVEGLRVADASVMPLDPSSNTNAPTIMVAEKAADHILGRLG